MQRTNYVAILLLFLLVGRRLITASTETIDMRNEYKASQLQYIFTLFVRSFVCPSIDCHRTR